MVDLPPITQNPLLGSNAATGQTPAATALAALLEIRVGQTVPALITNTSALTSAEREYLLQQVTTATKQSQNLTTELAKIESTRLFEVLVNNKTTHLLSHLPLQKGTEIFIKLRVDGALQFMPSTPGPQIKETNRAEINQTQTISTTAATKPGAPPSEPKIQLSPDKPTLLMPEPRAINTQQTLAALNKISQSYGARHLLDADSARTAEINKEQQLPKQTQAQLTHLREAIANVKVMAKPLAQIQQALEPINPRLTGTTEVKTSVIAQLLQQLTGLKYQGLDLKSLAVKPVQSMREAIQQSGVFYERHLAQQQNTSTVAEATLERDQKLLLLTLANALQQPLHTNTELNSAELKPLLAQLFKLFQPSSRSLPNNTTWSKQEVEQQLQAIAGKLRQGIAQIQLQQYRSAISVLSEPVQHQQSVWLDIPIRLFDGFGTISMMLREEKIEQDKTTEKRKKRKFSERWHVFLELELGDSGELAVELNVADKNLSAQLWASNQDLHQKANAQLQDLKQQLIERGLTVTDLRCHNAKPSKRPMHMDYSFIDVRT